MRHWNRHHGLATGGHEPSPRSPGTRHFRRWESKLELPPLSQPAGPDRVAFRPNYGVTDHPLLRPGRADPQPLQLNALGGRAGLTSSVTRTPAGSLASRIRLTPVSLPPRTAETSCHCAGQPCSTYGTRSGHCSFQLTLVDAIRLIGTFDPPARPAARRRAALSANRAPLGHWRAPAPQTQSPPWIG